MSKNKTSVKGIAFLERNEGVVLRAYRDVVGIWTIGAGLTKASGVVVPKPGMVINKAEASRLLQEALRRNYEPAVNLAMPVAKQHEFDGGVSFHWNTGAIGRASWVPFFRIKDWPEVKRRLGMWTKGGGKVFPGLVRRRDEEYALIAFGSYVGEYNLELSGLARLVVPQFTPAKMAALRKSLKGLGYHTGDDPLGIARAGIIKFQKDHGLTADGIIGRATLSTIQRMSDARRKPIVPGLVGANALVELQFDGWAKILADLPGSEFLGWIALGLSAGWFSKLGLDYRDAIAVKIQNQFPNAAAKLRSF